jgi:hypothetical protein
MVLHHRKVPLNVRRYSATFYLKKNWATSSWIWEQVTTTSRAEIKICIKDKFALPFDTGARGGAVGWGTALQAGGLRVRFPMVSLKLFIDIILPAALWPCDLLSL